MAHDNRLKAAAPQMLDALMALDAYWTEDWPEGPDSPGKHFIRLTNETVALWKQVRAAIRAAQGSQTINPHAINPKGE